MEFEIFFPGIKIPTFRKMRIASTAYSNIDIDYINFEKFILKTPAHFIRNVIIPDNFTFPNQFNIYYWTFQLFCTEKFDSAVALYENFRTIIKALIFTDHKDVWEFRAVDSNNVVYHLGPSKKKNLDIERYPSTFLNWENYPPIKYVPRNDVIQLSNGYGPSLEYFRPTIFKL